MTTTDTAEYERRAELWSQALRSGEFKQARDEMWDGQDAYCCLGVACEAFRRDTGIGYWDDGMFVAGEDDCEDGVLPEVVEHWYGINTRTGCFTPPGPGLIAIPRESWDQLDGGPVSLADMNDVHCLSFPEIATIIDQRPPGLFQWGYRDPSPKLPIPGDLGVDTIMAAKQALFKFNSLMVEDSARRTKGEMFKDLTADADEILYNFLNELRLSRVAEAHKKAKEMANVKVHYGG